MPLFLEKLVEKYPDLSTCLPAVESAYEILKDSYQRGGKLLVCGNGGSAADSEHIVGELMKGFYQPRPVSESVRQRLLNCFPGSGEYLAEHLQGALPAISLVSQSSLITAFTNDVTADMVFAQQVYGYGRPEDTLLGISTSGNSRNVIHALQVARAMSLHTIGLTGRDGGEMSQVCDTLICVAWDQTPDIQERHIAVYHALCAWLEETFFTK